MFGETHGNKLNSKGQVVEKKLGHILHTNCKQ